MVVDAILYNGERDIFNLRYEILKDVVDEFVVLEYGTTFSGNKKESNPIELPKVSYYFHEDAEGYAPQEFPEAFQREYRQREGIKDHLKHLKDSDTVFMGDCDEIWDATVLERDLSDPLKLRLRVYAYYLNNRSSENFELGNVVGYYHSIRGYQLNELRRCIPLTDEYYGWHFTNMGGIETIHRKIESYAHQEFNNDIIKGNLQNAIESNVDYVGRGFIFQRDESNWPEYLKNNREKYGHLLWEDYQNE